MYLMVNVNCFVEDKNLTFCEILIFLLMIFLWFYRIYYRNADTNGSSPDVFANG